MRAKDVMTTTVVSVRPDTPIKEVSAILLAHEISGAPVVDARGGLVGIVSETDLVALEASRREGWRRVRVPRAATDVMVRSVATLPPDAPVSDVAGLMLERRVTRIPIVQEGRLVGIVTRRDLLQVLARPDEDIRSELGALLVDGEQVIGRFQIDVEDGVVTLRGPSEVSARRVAELLARETPGVRDVEIADPR